jgi:hypothetical protein
LAAIGLLRQIEIPHDGFAADLPTLGKPLIG